MILSLAIILSAVVAVPVVYGFGKLFWAMRRGETFREFNERQSRAYMRRKRKSDDADRKRTRDGKTSWSLLLLGSAFLVLSFIGVYQAVNELADLTRASSWQETECAVLSVDSVQHNSSKGPTYFTPLISYAYRFGDRDLTGDRFDFVDRHFDREEIAAFKKNYAPGARFPCFVDPQNPSESVITRDFAQFPIYKDTIGLFFMLVFTAFLFYTALRENKS